MTRFLAILLTCLTLPLAARAEPVLKIINFTADWCPNCQILNPRLDEAVAAFAEGEVEVVNLDMTHAGRRSSDMERFNAQADAMRTAHAHNVRYLWDWYGGITGLAAIVAADNGEPISCVMRPMTAEDIEKRLKLAKILAERAPQGTRKPQGPDCPPPRNG